MIRSTWALGTAVAVTSSLLLGGACSRQKWPGPAGGTAATAALPMTSAAMPEASEGPARPFEAGVHPRILLTRDRLEMLDALARTPSPVWAALVKSCTESAGGKIESGYEGEDWATAALDLALCGRVLSKPALTKTAIRYWRALLDDKETVGDGQGSLKAVQGNDGYSIRNRGFLAAIAYDWLYDALSAEERKHGADRFHAFCTWYQKDGYKHDDPIANHYMGYFGACAMGGIALEGEDPRGAEMRRFARATWQKEIVPAYARLAGGDFPEGWQYARVPGAALAFYVDAEEHAGGMKPGTELPWLREAIAFQAHALQPDGMHVWDNADWSRKPARPFPTQLYAAALALGDDAAGNRALFLARLARRPDEPAWTWLHALADDPARKGEDPRRGATSYLAKGTGTMFARTDWTAGAVWIGMNASPAFGDHQHLDQGHFEVTRGGDALLIDPGDYDSYATMSHNTLLVDDGHANLRWSPNQGIWGKDVSIARFEDAGRTVYGLATFGEAYNPDGYPEDHPQRTVTRAERELLFSRTPLAGASGPSARLVLYDRVTLTKGSYGVIWAAHAGVAPVVQGASVGITVGRSSATITTLAPAAAPRLLKEPTVKSDDMFTKNDPAEGITSTRIEVASPAGATERRFLHVIAIGGAGDRPPVPVRIAGDGAEGAAIDGESYVFATSGPQRLPAAFMYRAPASAPRHVVTGLAPGAKYAIATTAQGALCGVSILPGGKVEATAAGVLAFELQGCAAPR